MPANSLVRGTYSHIFPAFVSPDFRSKVVACVSVDLSQRKVPAPTLENKHSLTFRQVESEFGAAVLAASVCGCAPKTGHKTETNDVFQLG